MKSIDKNLAMDLIENQKLSHEQASSVLKDRYPDLWGLLSRSSRRFSSKRTVSSKVSNKKVTEMEMEASNKVIFAFYPVDIQSHFSNARGRIDVETMSCVYRDNYNVFKQ